MPRNLKADTEELAPLTKQSAHTASPQVLGEQELIDTEHDNEQAIDMLMRDPRKETCWSSHHVRGSVLTERHVPQCLELEQQTFKNPDHRCTEEKIKYRLIKCPEVCFGLFISAKPGTKGMDAATAASAEPVVSDSDRKDVLIAHAISTVSMNSTVQDEDMSIVLEDELRQDRTKPHLGHKVQGPTIALHSLAVLPEYQTKGYGGMLLRDYIQRMGQQGLYDRITIITYQGLVPFYERFGFKNLGPSNARFGGGGWVDMVRDLEPFEPADVKGGKAAK